MERIVTQVRFEKPVIPKPKRVAAYARVSSGKDAMLHSLSAQVSYYSGIIQSHNGWKYAGVYADEALTGTKDNRDNFQRLINDCREGKIDMVITKSISRFARNTVTLLKTVHELKDLGVDVYFEEEKKEKVYQDQVHEEERYYRPKPRNSGMEMVQVAVLICIAVAVGLVFKEKILQFVDSTFDGLFRSGF